MKMKPKLLDLFCAAGGCAAGYDLAGFNVVGVDHVPQPRYPFAFLEADALDVLRCLLSGSSTLGLYLEDIAAIHASPPCQAFTSMKVMANAGKHDDLLTPTRELLERTGKPWVIENVVGAPMDQGELGLFGISGIQLCGSMFGLRTDEYELRRHRLFESSIMLAQPRCRHTEREVIGFYGDHARKRTRINGHHARGNDISKNSEKMALVKSLMGIDWMVWEEAKLAIPPAYTEFIGKQLMNAIQGK